MTVIVPERTATNADLVKLGHPKLPGYADYTIGRLQGMLGLEHMSGYDITLDVLSPITDTPADLPPGFLVRLGEELDYVYVLLGKCITLPR